MQVCCDELSTQGWYTRVSSSRGKRVPETYKENSFEKSLDKSRFLNGGTHVIPVKKIKRTWQQTEALLSKMQASALIYGAQFKNHTFATQPKHPGHLRPRRSAVQRQKFTKKTAIRQVKSRKTSPRNLRIGVKRRVRHALPIPGHPFGRTCSWRGY